MRRWRCGIKGINAGKGKVTERSRARSGWGTNTVLGRAGSTGTGAGQMAELLLLNFLLFFFWVGGQTVLLWSTGPEALLPLVPPYCHQLQPSPVTPLSLTACLFLASIRWFQYPQMIQTCSLNFSNFSESGNFFSPTQPPICIGFLWQSNKPPQPLLQRFYSLIISSYRSWLKYFSTSTNFNGKSRKEEEREFGSSDGVQGRYLFQLQVLGNEKCRRKNSSPLRLL